MITPAMKALEKRTTICLHAIHKLPQNLIDIPTKLDISRVYIRPHFIGCLAAFAFAPKTTIAAFFIHFLFSLKKIAGVLKDMKMRKFLIAFNKIQPLYRIQNVYKSILTKLAEWNLIEERPIYAERVEVAFH